MTLSVWVCVCVRFLCLPLVLWCSSAVITFRHLHSSHSQIIKPLWWFDAAGLFSWTVLVQHQHYYQLWEQARSPAAVNAVTELTLGLGSGQSGCLVPFVHPPFPPRLQQCGNNISVFTCWHLAVREKPRQRVPVIQPLCSSLSDAMWNAPSCHQIQYPTHKTHRKISTHLPLRCQHSPLAADSMLTYRG